MLFSLLNMLARAVLRVAPAGDRGERRAWTDERDCRYC